MRLIGLTGKAGCGKDTVAEYLITRHKFIHYKFAGPLKDMLAAIGVDCTTPERKNIPEGRFGKTTPRRMMQTLGTEWGRCCVHPDMWVILAKQFIESLIADASEPVSVVISDVRFENEATMINVYHGTVWHIGRNEIPEVESHVSEEGIQGCGGDEVIYNNGTLQDLYDQIDRRV
jgi:hypothetical protein